MTFPASLTLVTVNVRADLLPDGGSTGSVRLYHDGLPLTGPAADSIVVYVDETRDFDTAGTSSMQVPATNALGWTPQDFAYNVTVRSGTRVRRGTVQLDRATTTVNLADVIQWEGAATPGVTYATLAQLQALDIDDIADLQTQLDGKQPAGTYLTPDDITNLVSSESFTEGLALKLDKANGEVVDSTFGVRKGDSSSGIRMRSTGGAVDFDKMNGDIVVSSFAGPGYTGTQTGLQRWRATGSTFAGLTEFGDTVYNGQQSIDAAAGLANVGAKNGATNLKMAGYLDVSGAPSAGTWAVGEIVMTRTGVYRCITAGTPGTWTNYSNDAQVFHAIEAGYGGWSYDPAQTQAGTILPTAGLSFVVRMRIFTSVISAINLHLTVAGSGLTNAFATVHNDAGVKIGAGAVTANQNTNLQTGGERTMPLSVAQGVTPGDFYKIRFWATGTTLPTLSRACNSSSAIVNAGLSAPNFRWATADGSLTDAASAPDTIGTMAGGATAWWVAVKP